MATKAEEWKADMQRAAHAGKPKQRATHGAKAKKPPAKPHNLTGTRGRKSTYHARSQARASRPSGNPN